MIFSAQLTNDFQAEHYDALWGELFSQEGETRAQRQTGEAALKTVAGIMGACPSIPPAGHGDFTWEPNAATLEQTASALRGIDIGTTLASKRKHLARMAATWLNMAFTSDDPIEIKRRLFLVLLVLWSKTARPKSSKYREIDEGSRIYVETLPFYNGFNISFKPAGGHKVRDLNVFHLTKMSGPELKINGISREAEYPLTFSSAMEYVSSISDRGIKNVLVKTIMGNAEYMWACLCCGMFPSGGFGIL